MTIRAVAAIAAVGLALPAPQSIEQTSQGRKPAAALVESFDGLGVGFEGPQGRYEGRNPSDNSLAVGPDHIVQTVNSRLAVFTKKGTRFDTTGRPLYGPVNTNLLFAGLGGPCASRNNGDAVVRYDQLAGRWLVTMPIFTRVPLAEVGERPPIGKPAPPGAGGPRCRSPPVSRGGRGAGARRSGSPPRRGSSPPPGRHPLREARRHCRRIRRRFPRRRRDAAGARRPPPRPHHRRRAP